MDQVNPKYHVIAGGGVEAREVTQTTEGGFESVIFNMVLEEEIGKVEADRSAVRECDEKG